MKLMVCLMAVAVAVGVVGCKQNEQSAGAGQAAADVNTGGQTICPVMGGPINPKISTQYQGKTVYFCCSGCIETFKKDPNSYIGKLPQFKK